MASSGTTGFDLNLKEIIEEAYEQAGLEVRSGYEFRTARRSLNLLLLEWANRGLNLWTVAEGTIALAAGVDTYALPADTVDLIEYAIREGCTDYSITRISVDSYSRINNKTMQSRPQQVLVRRVVPPSIRLWPVPDRAAYSFVYWRLRRMHEFTRDGDENADVPFRYLPALTAGLAWKLAMKSRRPEVLQRVPLMKTFYEEQMRDAEGEDRERATLRIVPRIA